MSNCTENLALLAAIGGVAIVGWLLFALAALAGSIAIIIHRRRHRRHKPSGKQQKISELMDWRNHSSHVPELLDPDSNIGTAISSDGLLAQ